MADLGRAVISLGQLIGLLAKEGGAVQWSFFANPVKQSLSSAAGNPEAFGALQSALLDGAQPEQYGSDATRLWLPIPGMPVEAGFVWNKESPPKESPPGTSPQLRVGFGARVTIAGGDTTQSTDDFSLSGLAGLVDLQSSGLKHELGTVEIDGAVPSPLKFLAGGTLNASIPLGEVGLTVNDTVGGSRNVSTKSTTLSWDCVRVAIFVLRAWVRDAAAAPGDNQPIDRVDKHLFPMLGDPANDVIEPFPLIGDKTGEQPDFGAWAESVLNTDDGAPGALTFLWHARALLTGNESGDFLGGSVYFPLAGSASSGTTTTPPPFTKRGDIADSKGAFIGIVGPPSGPRDLVLVLRPANLPEQTITLARRNANEPLEPLSRPTLEKDPGPIVEAVNSIGGLKATEEQNAAIVTVLEANLIGAPSNSDALHLVLAKDAPAGVRVQTAQGPLDLTAGAEPRHALAQLLHWTVAVLVRDRPALAEHLQLINAALRLITDPLDGKPLEPLAPFAALSDGKLDIGPLAIIALPDIVKSDLHLGPFAPGELTIDGAESPIHIGKLTASAEIGGKGLKQFSLGLNDVRLGNLGGGVTGLVGGLVPDLREVDGFAATVIWTPSGALSVSGGGKIPVQRTLAGFDIVSLDVKVTDKQLSLGIDLSFELAMIRVSAYDLTLTINFAGAVEASLGGLGVAFEAGSIRLAGMFGATTAGDYVGSAVVTVGELFELSAIGGYTQLGKDTGDPGEASLFIFASLVAPLGGPPFFFVTGIAGGFGYNRALPPPGSLLAEHPFLKVMSGEIAIDAAAPNAGQLDQLGAHFAAQKGSHWVAAGVQFTSFGFIDGKLVVVVGTGRAFSLSILGQASFGIDRVASFELAFDATMDHESLVIVAGMTPESYIVDPDIFSLRGDFGLGVWHSGPHAGDFVLSIGGYHKAFDKPAHYPSLDRVKANAIVYGFIRLKVECYFACTPQALMAGAMVSLSAEFEGIGAGLDVYFDVWIEWEPFFMQASLRIVVWFEFLGRHEISVGLEIHTPEFGGIAVIDAEVVSFELQFGADLPRPYGLSLDQFLSRQLSVPAQPAQSAQSAHGGAVVSRFNTDDRAGLFRVDVLSGRASVEPPAPSARQEGLTQSTAVAANAEFSFAIRTKLPIAAEEEDGALAQVSGLIDLPLCLKNKYEAQLTVTLAISDAADDPGIEWQTDRFPVAAFGDAPVKPVQAGDEAGRADIQAADHKPCRELTDQLLIVYGATTTPTDDDALVTASAMELPEPQELLPLPLGVPAGVSPGARTARPAHVFGNIGGRVAPRAPLAPRRRSTREQMADAVRAPLNVLSQSADLQRPIVSTRQGSLRVAQPPAGAAVIGPPPSPPRRPELAAVSVRILPIHAPTQIAPKRIARLSPARNLQSSRLSSSGAADGSFTGAITIVPGRATKLEIEGGRRPRGRLTFTGAGQTVRAISLGSSDEPIADAYVAGDHALSLPRHTRRVVLVGEGARSPLARGVARESIGIDPSSTLLALAPRVFAGHGCVLHVLNAMTLSPRALDSVPGEQVLREARRVRLLLPPLPPRSTLVLRVAPTRPDAAPAADEVRWATADARLADLRAIVGPVTSALVMSVAAAERWQLDIDVGAGWRIVSVAVTPRAARDLAAHLSRGGRWDLVDDRRQQDGAESETRVVLEVA